MTDEKTTASGELLACPNGCQTATPEITESWGQSDGFYVLCPVCQMRGAVGYSDDIALSHWNALPRHDSQPRESAGLDRSTLLSHRGKLGAVLIQMMSFAGTERQEEIKAKANTILNEISFSMAEANASGVDPKARDMEVVKSIIGVIEARMNRHTEMAEHTDYPPELRGHQTAVIVLGGTIQDIQAKFDRGDFNSQPSDSAKGFDEFDTWLNAQIRAARLVLSQRPSPRELTLQEVQREFRRRFLMEGK